MNKLAISLIFVSLTLLIFVNCEQCGHKCRKPEPKTITEFIEAVGRSVTTSQVVTVNFKNAMILAALKAIVIVAGVLGKFSFWTFPGLGAARKLDHFEKKVVDEIKLSLMSNEDMRWISTYMWSLNKGNFGCLYRLACENPHSAVIYSEAAVILRDIFNFSRLLKQKKFYEKIMFSVDEASKVGFQSRSNCKLYSCHAPFKHG